MRLSELLSATAFAALLAAAAVPAHADQRRGSGTQGVPHGAVSGGHAGGGHGDHRGYGSGGSRYLGNRGGYRYGGGTHDGGFTRHGGNRYGHSRGHWIYRRVHVYDPYPRFVLRRVWDDGYDVDGYGYGGYGVDGRCECE